MQLIGSIILMKGGAKPPPPIPPPAPSTAAENVAKNYRERQRRKAYGFQDTILTDEYAKAPRSLLGE